MTVVAVVDLVLCGVALVGIVGLLLWAIVTQERDRRPRRPSLLPSCRCERSIFVTAAT